MKKTILSSALVLFSIIVVSQSIIQRSGISNTVQDARLRAQYNLFLPTYLDTVAANNSRGIDSSGAMIKTYSPDGVWFRQSFPKKWVLIMSGSGAGTVTSVARTNGYGIIASVANSTTTPNITITADTTVLASKTFVSNSNQNFANTNLTATGNRVHNWNGYDYKQDSVGTYEVSTKYSNSLGYSGRIGINSYNQPYMQTYVSEGISSAVGSGDAETYMTTTDGSSYNQVTTTGGSARLLSFDGIDGSDIITYSDSISISSNDIRIRGNTYSANSNHKVLTQDTTTGRLYRTALPTGTVTSVSGTTNRITVATGTTTPVIDIGTDVVTLTGTQTLTNKTLGLTTLTGNLLFSADNTYDIGASGATRARTGYFGTSVNSPEIVSYNTADQTTNYERVRQYWSGNIFNITGDKAGTGVDRTIEIKPTGTLGLGASGTVRAYINGSNVIQGLLNVSGSSSSANASSLGITGTMTQSSGLHNGLVDIRTINQTSTAGYRGLWISPYEQATGSGSKLLIDAGTNSAADGGGTHTSKFSVDNTGAATALSFIKSGGTSSQFLKADGSVDAGAYTTTSTAILNRTGTMPYQYAGFKLRGSVDSTNIMFFKKPTGEGYTQFYFKSRDTSATAYGTMTIDATALSGLIVNSSNPALTETGELLVQNGSIQNSITSGGVDKSTLLNSSGFAITGNTSVDGTFSSTGAATFSSTISAASLTATNLTANYIPKAGTGGLLGNSTIYENASGYVGLGNTNPYSRLHVQGFGYVNSLQLGDKADVANSFGANFSVFNTAPNGVLNIEIAKSGIGYGVINMNGSVSVLNGIKVTGFVAPTGIGTEIGYTGGVGFIQAYNRTSPAYLPLNVGGTTVTFQSSGTDIAAVSSTGLNVVSGKAYTYNSVNALYGQTALANWYMGDAGNLTSTGDQNTYSGKWAGLSNTSGRQNTFTGFYAGVNNTTGSQNVLYGGYAGSSINTGNFNSFFGHEAGKGTTTGSNNFAMGSQALFSNTTGGSNIAIGTTTGLDVTTGSSNTFIGTNTGRGVTIGNNNTVIGANVTLPSYAEKRIVISDGQGNQRINVDSLGKVTFNGNVGIGVAPGNVPLSMLAPTAAGTSNMIRLYDDGAARTSTSNNSAGIGLNLSTSEFTFTNSNDATGAAKYTFYGGNVANFTINSLGNTITKGHQTIGTTSTPAPASGSATFWFDGTNVKITKNVGGVTTTATIF